MGFIVFGVSETPIGLDEFLIDCPLCESHSWADIMIVSKYFHIYYLPFFPTEKDANVICNTCGLKRYGMFFNQSLINNYNEVKGNFRHPFFTYSGLIIVILIVVSIIFASIS